MIMEDYDNNGRQWKIINDYERQRRTIERQWLEMVELRRGTFLVLEDIWEYENSGDYTRVQGKYQGKPRRHILDGYGLCGSLGDIGSVLVSVWRC